MHAKSAQAMIEFAICLLAFALVLSALLAFGSIMPKSTALQSEVRRTAGCAAQGGAGGTYGALPQVIIENLPQDVRAVSVVELTASERHDTAELNEIAAKYFFEANADNEFRIHERATMPSMHIPGFIVNNPASNGGAQ